MLVNDWVETLWSVLNVRPKTLQNYKHQYSKYLEPVMGSVELDNVEPVAIQMCLLSLPPQTSRHYLCGQQGSIANQAFSGHQNPSNSCNF